MLFLLLPRYSVMAYVHTIYPTQSSRETVRQRFYERKQFCRREGPQPRVQSHNSSRCLYQLTTQAEPPSCFTAVERKEAGTRLTYGRAVAAVSTQMFMINSNRRSRRAVGESGGAGAADCREKEHSEEWSCEKSLHMKRLF